MFVNRESRPAVAGELAFVLRGTRLPWPLSWNRTWITPKVAPLEGEDFHHLMPVNSAVAMIARAARRAQSTCPSHRERNRWRVSPAPRRSRGSNLSAGLAATHAGGMSGLRKTRLSSWTTTCVCSPRSRARRACRVCQNEGRMTISLSRIVASSSMMRCQYCRPVASQRSMVWPLRLRSALWSACPW